MSIDVLYWHWILLGIALMIIEIFSFTFVALWFGVAAIVVGLIKLAIPAMTLTWAVLLWAVVSCVLTFLWFKYIKPKSIDKTKAGLSRERIVGEVGQVLSVPQGSGKGILRFSVPVLGGDEWEFISEEALAIGDRVSVTDVLGNALVVKKL